jgi:hypothetical protein
MSKIVSQQSMHFIQTPWEMYDHLEHVILDVVNKGNVQPHDKVWLADELRECTFRLDFKPCDFDNLLKIVSDKGIIPQLLITTEDSASWSSYTQKYEVKDIANSIVEYRPKNKISAHEGLTIRVRIIVKDIQSEQITALRKYSVIAEKIIHLHVDTYASEFDVRQVDALPNDIVFRVVANPSIEPFEQPLHECIYIEFLKQAYEKYVLALNTKVGKAFNAMILSNIIAESAYLIASEVRDRSPEEIIISSNDDDPSMVVKLCKILDYVTFQEFQRDLIDFPEQIMHRARKRVHLAKLFITIT